MSLALGTAACTSIRPVAPAKLSSKQLPQVVSVTYQDQTVLVVMDPELSADTLKGVRWGTQDSVAIPLASVQTVQAKVPDRTKTLVLVATVGLLTLSGVYVVLNKTGQPNASDTHCFGDEAMKHPDQYPECGT
ncbi:MAG TPA: hypothetical protein VLV16_13840 [Gemmatimonadales bacterium]|nr:hypothetical protein [Gemmatimonadales bacterium]